MSAAGSGAGSTAGSGAGSGTSASAPNDPTAHYNLGCSLALVGRVEEALDALEQAEDLGYDDAEHLLADEDLASLRGESRFRSLAERLSRHEA